MKYVDIHCHSGMKPIGKSFKHSKPFVITENDLEKNYSLWYQDPPSKFDKFLNKLLSITKFTQSDFKSVVEGNIGLIVVSLGPPEKGFIKTRLGSGLLPLLLVGLVNCLPYKRLRYLVKTQSYFRDIEQEMDYFEIINDFTVSGPTIDLGNLSVEGRFKLVNNLANPLNTVTFGDDDNHDIQVVFSIEGANLFDKGLIPKTETAIRETVLGNIDRVKNWKYRPLWVSIGHHFYNEMSGHSSSLPCIVKSLINQKHKIDTGITPFGKEVIRKLLGKDPSDPNYNPNDPKRIKIDIKHMSNKARRDFYIFCEEEYYQTPDKSQWDPIVVSHAACNGWKDNACYSADEEERHNTPSSDFEGIRNNSAPIGDYFIHKNFFGKSINLTDEDIINVALTGGIIGIQLDQRRLATKKAWKEIKKNIKLNMPVYDEDVISPEINARNWWSLPIWENLLYMAKIVNTLDIDESYAPWHVQCVGSDFDGVVDPLDCFWTSKEIGFRPINTASGNSLNLYDGLKFHAYYYSQNRPDFIFNYDPEVILARVMSENAFEFIKQKCLRI